MELKETEHKPNAPWERASTMEEFISAPENRHVFPSPHSIRWFVRCNEKALVHAGALVRASRRIFIVQPEFNEVLISILQEKERKRLAD